MTGPRPSMHPGDPIDPAAMPAATRPSATRPDVADDPGPGTSERSQPAEDAVDRLLEEGPGAPDAADIEDPTTQR